MSGMTDAEAIGIVFAAISNEAYEKTQPALHHIAARLRGEGEQVVAWIDNTGAPRGTVSDEQLIAIFGNAIRECERRSGLSSGDGEQGAVAWRYRYGGGWTYTEVPQAAVEREHGFEVSQPLYTHPKPTATVSPPTVAGSGETVRALVAKAKLRAQVFDDASDGADAESARSVVALLTELEAALSAAPQAPQQESDNND